MAAVASVDPAIRFHRHVDKTEDGCWLWAGGLTGGGYGNFKVRSYTIQMAHRWAYEHYVGPIQDGLQIDHLCRVRNCVNPAHLEPVTPAENTRRAAAVRTACPAGHEFTPESTHIVTTPEGWRGRRCRTCDRERRRERRRREREQMGLDDT